MLNFVQLKEVRSRHGGINHREIRMPGEGALGVFRETELESDPGGTASLFHRADTEIEKKETFFKDP